MARNGLKIADSLGCAFFIVHRENWCKTIYATYEEKDNRNHDWKRWISIFFWSRYIIIFCNCFLCRFVGWTWVQSDAWDSKRIQKYVSRNPKTNPTIQTNKISHGPPFSNDFWIFSVKFLKKKEFTLATYLTEFTFLQKQIVSEDFLIYFT